MARRARVGGEVVDDDDEEEPSSSDGDNADDAATANVASVLLWRELVGGSGRRAARVRRTAAAAAAAMSASSPPSSSQPFLPPPCLASPTDPSAAALVWAEAALLRRARSRYLDLRPAPSPPAPPFARGPRSTIAARFSADGALLACSHGDHALRVWCAETGRALCVLQGHARTPWCVAWHPHRADTLASGSLDGAVLMWRLLARPPRDLHHSSGAHGRGGAAAASGGLGAGSSSMPSPPRLVLQRRLRGGNAATEGEAASSPPQQQQQQHNQPPSPSSSPPMRARLIARHDFRRPVASLAFAPSGDVLAVQAGRRMFTWRYGAEASPAASPRGGLPLAAPPTPPLPSAGGPVAAVSSAAAAAATAPVEIYQARNTLRMVAPHPAPGVPLLLTAEVMPGAAGGSGGAGSATADREAAAASGTAPVSLRDLPEALAPEVAARRRAEGRVYRRGATASSSSTAAAAAALPSRRRGGDNAGDDGNDDAERGPRAAAVAAALAILRLRLAEAEGDGGGLAAAAAGSGGGMPPYLLSELMGAAAEAWARAGGGGGGGDSGGGGGGGGDNDNGAGAVLRTGQSVAAVPIGQRPAAARGADPSALMRDQAWASRVRQWASRRGEEQLREEEREAWGEEPLAPAGLAARAAVARAIEVAGVDASILAGPAAPPLSPRPPRSPASGGGASPEQQHHQQHAAASPAAATTAAAAAAAAGAAAAEAEAGGLDLERVPSTAGLVAALPASTRTFSPEWLLPSSSQSPRPPGAAAAAPPALPPPPPQQQQQQPSPLYGQHHPPLVTTGELPGYRRYWASDEAGADRAVHLGGARPSARDGAAAAAAAAAAPALAAAAEAFRETAIAACQGAQALPCLATLRLWRWDEEDGSAGDQQQQQQQQQQPQETDDGGAATDDDAAAALARPPHAAAPVRRPAPAFLRPPRLLKIPCAVLCSEVSASISPCGRTLAAVVACRPAGLRPGHPLLQQPQQQQQADQGVGGGLEHAVYELRVYSIELTPVAANTRGERKTGAEGEAAAAASAKRPPSAVAAAPPLLGRLLRARAIPAAHCLTTVLYSPTGAHLLLAYGRRHISLCSLAAAGSAMAAAAASPFAGSAGGGSAAASGAAPTAEVVPVHSVVEFYRSDDLSLVRVLPSLADEANAAAWRGGSGVWGAGGAAVPAAFAYGTKEGRVRFIELG